MGIFGNKQKKFTDEELKFICGRIEIELEWGTSVYMQSEIELMHSIISKIKK